MCLEIVLVSIMSLMESRQPILHHPPKCRDPEVERRKAKAQVSLAF
jgi:hypothetical protein